MKIKTLFAVASVFALSFISTAQTRSFSFDGIDDYAELTNGSSFIANKSGISLSVWCYPTSTPSGYPYFGGILGYRNESNCDFYILQLGGNNVEARVRTTTGVYTIAYNSGLNINAWNHFALTYDGSNLILYHNGVLAGSQSASGSITNSTVPFNIGYIPFSSSNFYFEGKVDDAAVWSTVLSASDVTELYNACKFNTGASGLELLYMMEQGTAGGNNATITSLDESIQRTNMPATLYNTTMTGATSNFALGSKGNTASTIHVISCESSFTLPSGSRTVTSSGTYRDTVSNGSGCDSVITAVVTISPLNDSVTVANGTATSLETASTTNYQWMDCSTNMEISGETNATYSPTSAGNYAVIVSNAACSDTSDCYFVDPGMSVSEHEQLFSVYPNPARANVLVHSLNGNVTSLELVDLTGKTIYKEDNLNSESTTFSVAELPEGVYILKLNNNDDSSSVHRLVVRH